MDKIIERDIITIVIYRNLLTLEIADIVGIDYKICLEKIEDITPKYTILSVLNTVDNRGTK